MPTRRLVAGLLLLVGSVAAETFPEDPDGAAWRVQTVRAAPGELGALIEAYAVVHREGLPDGLVRPWMIRHAQGDHWDLMLLYPIESFAACLAALERAGQDRHWRARRAPIETRIAFSDELLMHGPAHEVVAARFAGGDFAHIEVFHALAGRRQALVDQRRMENAYLRGTGQTPNLIFVAGFGGDADVMTLGLHASFAAFAAAPEMPDAERDKVARAVGFAGLDDIGLHLRGLLLRHHDTLGHRIDAGREPAAEPDRGAAGPSTTTDHQTGNLP